MAQKSLYQLTLDINANSAKLSQGLAKANSSLGGTGKAASGFGKIMNDVFKEAAGYIDNIIPGFSNFTSKLLSGGKAVGTLSGAFKVLKVAIASTGIGLLVIAIGSLVALFTKTDRGADKLSEKLAGIKAVINVLIQRLALFGEGLLMFLKGDFRGGIDKMKESFSNLKDEIKDSYTEAEKIKQSLNNLADVEAEFILTEAELSNKLALAREKITDEDASRWEKQKALNDAVKAESDLYEKQKAILWEKYRITKEQNDILRRNGEDNEDMLAAENTILAEIENKNGERALSMSRINKMQKTLTAEVEKEAKARLDALNALKISLSLKPVLPSGGAIDPTSLSQTKGATVFPAPDLSLAEQAWVDYKDGIISIWQMIENQALSSFNEIKNAAVDVGGILANTLTNAISGLGEAFGNLFAGTEAGFKGIVTTALTVIQEIINALLAQAIAGMIAGESKKGLVGLITGAIGVGALLALWKSKVPEFASGTNFAPGGLSLVGERGPELVNLPRGSQVYSNLQSRNMMTHITVDGVIRGKDLVLIQRRASQSN